MDILMDVFEGNECLGSVDVVNIGLIKDNMEGEIDWELMGFMFMSKVLNGEYKSGWEEGEKFLEGMRQRVGG
jgi:hypothetical protein